MKKQFIRLQVKVPVQFFVGPIDVPVPDGVDPATWDNDDILAEAMETVENAVASAMPSWNCKIQAYPTEHPFKDEWVPVQGDVLDYGDAEIDMSEQVEHDL